MNSEIQIRKTLDGRIQARRLDGKTMTSQDRAEARRIAILVTIPNCARIVEEIRDGQRLRALQLYSTLLQDCLWIVIDRTYQPSDGLALYYPEELSNLRGKSIEQLREIHKIKLVYPGCRVIQEGIESFGDN